MDRLLSAQELKSAYQKVSSLNSPTFEVLSGDPLAGTLFGTKPPIGCNLTLQAAAQAFPGNHYQRWICDALQEDRFGRRKSQENLFEPSGPLPRLLWQLRKRESYTGKCGHCSLWPSCRGCRAVAYAYSAAQGKPDLFADDPQCWITPSPSHIRGKRRLWEKGGA